jgi:hypothetical protein
MATEDNTHISRTFTSQELHSLADRMFSRGISALSPLNREIRLDMVTCSGGLRRLAISISTSGRTCRDEGHLSPQTGRGFYVVKDRISALENW